MQGCAIEDTMDSGVGRQKRELWVLLIYFLFSESSRTPLGVSRIETEMSKLSLAKRHANSANQNLENILALRVSEFANFRNPERLKRRVLFEMWMIQWTILLSLIQPRTDPQRDPGQIQVPRRRERLRASDVHRRRAGGAG